MTSPYCSLKKNTMDLSALWSLQWVDRFSWPSLIIFAVLLGMAPFPMQPEPHLIEKLRMLVQGNLSKPIDIFDLFLHAAPLIVIAIKGYRVWSGVAP